MGSFKWKDGEVFIKPATGWTKNLHWTLKHEAGVYDMEVGAKQDAITSALYLLARVDRVEGNIGFPVPNGNANKESLLKFCNDLLDGSEDLFLLWNGTANATKVGGNDPALLPPHEVDDAKKNSSQSNDESNGETSKNG